MSLFDMLEEQNKQTPLAELLRPKTLSEYLGQNQLFGQNEAILNLLKSGRLFSLLIWGPPGCGKTTLSRLIAAQCDANFIELSAVTSGIKDLKEAVESARDALRNGRKTIVFIDEIHRYSKTQQDALLPHIEKGTIYLIGATTENPSFQVIPALLSRTQVARLGKIDDENMLKVIRRGFKYLIDNHGKVNLNSDIGEFIVKYADGDARLALNLVENSYFASSFKDGERYLNVDIIEELAQSKAVKYSAQEHYDIASAFQKSLRGSDENASIYWLAKMISAGEDPRFIARRLVVCASEDVGNADPNALQVAMHAYKAVELLGLPEGRIPLAQAVQYVANAPKSNASYRAIDSALYDIQNGENYEVPMHLRDSHYKDAKKHGFGQGYVYTHSNPDVKQSFLPQQLANKKYFD